MKYLFFDIECSNCLHGFGKMCEFGYVLTDEKFNVIKKGDIPMSPGKGPDNAFYLRGRKGEKDLELAYEYDYYLSQPEFPEFYDRIKSMMEDPDTICFAYAMGNDIHHLYHSCKRYKLEPLNYLCYDVQKLASIYLNTGKMMSLKKACLRIVGPHSMTRLIEHLSRDDAEMEKLIFEAVCELTGKDSKELLKSPEFVGTNSNEYMKIARQRVKRKINSEGHKLYNSLAIPNEDLDKEENIGRRYNISGELKAKSKYLKDTINLIQERNGLLCNQLRKTDYFIVLDEKNKEEILGGLKHPFDGKILTYAEFINSKKN